MSRRLLVTGPLDAVRAFDLCHLQWTSSDVARATEYAPIDLVRTMTTRDEIVLLDGWETDRDACNVVVVGLWLGLPFFRIERDQPVPCTPRSPVLEFTDLLAGVHT